MTPFESIKAALADATARAFMGDDPEERAFNAEWTPSGSGFGFLHRPAAGMTIVELDYDYPAKVGSVPQWVAIVWRSAVAFETGAENGKAAVVFLEAPAPSALDARGLKRLAKFAVGCLRLAPGVEIVTEPSDDE